MTEEQTACPLCGASRPYSPRYPTAVCLDCVAKAADEHGRRVVFSNVSFSGGLAGRYLDSGEPYLSEDCWIDGVKCRASEAHMGGTVILAPPG